jgi:hypothetical protein
MFLKLEDAIKALLSDPLIKSIMLDQEAVLDALYNREREPDTKYVSSIRGNDASSGINSTEESSVPKDVKKNQAKYHSFYMLTFNSRYTIRVTKDIRNVREYGPGRRG